MPARTIKTADKIYTRLQPEDMTLALVNKRIAYIGYNTPPHRGYVEGFIADYVMVAYDSGHTYAMKPDYLYLEHDRDDPQEDPSHTLATP